MDDGLKRLQPIFDNFLGRYFLSERITPNKIVDLARTVSNDIDTWELRGPFALGSFKEIEETPQSYHS